jgi:hypothetical protein
MQTKSTRNARIIFSGMVPLTIFAFVLASFSEPTIILGTPDALDVGALVAVTIGVWMYNWFEEKPQKASIEHL